MVIVNNGNKVIIKREAKTIFQANCFLSNNDILKCFEFAEKIADPNKEGYHTLDSFGGKDTKHIRTRQEQFINTFQGKLSEIGFYNKYKDFLLNGKYLFKLNEPDFNLWGEGIWEDADFIAKEPNGNQLTISLKSTKHIGNLLMLEKNRYNNDGYYLENRDGGPPIRHDLIFLCRVSNINKENIPYFIKNDFSRIEVEITGYITHNQFCNAIKQNKVIPKDSILGGGPLKVDNYWIATTELRKSK